MSLPWLEEKRRQEGKARSRRNYPLTAQEAFAHASEPYFPSELLEAAQQAALPPSPARRGDRYLKAWDIGRKEASVCVVLRAHRCMGDLLALQCECGYRADHLVSGGVMSGVIDLFICDVVLLDDAQPHAIALQLRLLSSHGEHAERA